MLQFRHQAIAEQRGIRFCVGLGLPILRLGLGDQRLLRQQRGGRVGICTLETGFGAQQLQARVHDLLRQRGVLQFEDHVVGLHLRAGPQQDSGDAPVGARGNPGGVDRHEGARAAHLTDQFAPGDGVEPQRAAVDGRRGRRHPHHGRAADNGEDERGQGHAHAPPAAAAAFLRSQRNIRHTAIQGKVRANVPGGPGPCRTALREP